MIAFFMAALVPIPALRAFSLQVRVCILSVSTCLEPLRPVMLIQKNWQGWSPMKWAMKCGFNK